MKSEDLRSLYTRVCSVYRLLIIIKLIKQGYSLAAPAQRSLCVFLFFILFERVRCSVSVYVYIYPHTGGSAYDMYLEPSVKPEARRCEHCGSVITVLSHILFALLITPHARITVVYICASDGGAGPRSCRHTTRGTRAGHAVK